MELIAPVIVDGIFTGKVGFLPGESRSSAIAKEPLAGRCVIGPEGLAGDEARMRQCCLDFAGIEPNRARP